MMLRNKTIVTHGSFSQYFKRASLPLMENYTDDLTCLQKLHQMQNQDNRIWQRIPVDSMNFLTNSYEVNMYQPQYEESKAIRARIIILHDLPHFLFFYKIDERGKSNGVKNSFSLKKIYKFVSKNTWQGFVYGTKAWNIIPSPQNIFDTSNVILFEHPEVNAQLFIEFKEEYIYMRWLTSIMFLLRTTNKRIQGIRDPRLDLRIQSPRIKCASPLGNIIQIEESSQNEVWNDIKVEFEIQNMDGQAKKDIHTEFFISDLMESNTMKRLDFLSKQIDDRISLLNTKIFTQFFFESSMAQKIQRQQNRKMNMLDLVNGNLKLQNTSNNEIEKFKSFPMFQDYHFRFKDRRQILKCFKAVPIADIAHDIKWRLANFNATKLEFEIMNEHPAEKILDLIHIQNLSIMDQLAAASHFKILARTKSHRAGKFVKQRKMNEYARWLRRLSTTMRTARTGRTKSMDKELSSVLNAKREWCRKCTIF